MPNLTNFYVRIVEWFQDRKYRKDLLLEFNRNAKNAFIHGVVPVLMEARVVKGDPKYRHGYSKIFEGSGFRIKSYAGKQLTRQEIINIGATILANETLVHRLVVLGFDTLQVHCDVGNYGCQWRLEDFTILLGASKQQ